MEVHILTDVLSGALSEVEKTLQQEGIETEIFFIGHDPIRGCMGCGMCRKNKLGKCILEKMLLT